MAIGVHELFRLTYTLRNLKRYLAVLPKADPNGQYVMMANQSGAATYFAVNPSTGNLQDAATSYNVCTSGTNSNIGVTQIFDATTGNSPTKPGLRCAP